MKNRNDYAKIFTVSIAFLMVFLVFSVNALPLGAKTTSTPMNLPIQQVGPEDPMYKYLYHVGVTENPWPSSRYDPEFTRFNPTTTMPNTNHILWIGKTRKYEATTGAITVVAGMVIIAARGTQSAYDNMNVLYAFDQNNGKLMWTYPGRSAGRDREGHGYLSGNVMIDPATGSLLYKTPTSLHLYVPELKMGFRTSGNQAEGWDFTDPKNAVRLWRTEGEYETAGDIMYADGKVVFRGQQLDCYITACDARTGTVLWETTTWGDSRQPAQYANGKLFCSTMAGFRVYDANTGNLVWEREPQGKAFGLAALAYGNVYTSDVNEYHYCFKQDTGEVVWKYIGERTGGYPAAGDQLQYKRIDRKSIPVVADDKVIFMTLGPNRYGTGIPANWVSEDGAMNNPHAFKVLAQCGSAEICCLDAHHGNLIWKANEEQCPPGGPNTTEIVVAEGRVYARQETMSGHVGVGDARPHSLFDYDKIVNYDWFPGQVYCFGPGPVQMTVSTDKNVVNVGETITISGTAVDMSPASPLAPAAKLPVYLSYTGTAEGSIGMVKTDLNGQFSINWAPSTAGALAIIASSGGSDSYEAPQDVTTVVTVSQGATLSTFGTIAGIIAITVSAAAITVPIRKRKHEGEELS
jgi:outer membrane protein assembly factor BamB